jgi:ELMO/CED-12 family
MGLLGLHCLLFIATCFPERTQVIIAKHEQREGESGTFPWACAGINVCAMLYDLFQVYSLLLLQKYTYLSKKKKENQFNREKSDPPFIAASTKRPLINSDGLEHQSFHLFAREEYQIIW